MSVFLWLGLGFIFIGGAGAFLGPIQQGAEGLHLFSQFLDAFFAGHNIKPNLIEARNVPPSSIYQKPEKSTIYAFVHPIEKLENIAPLCKIVKSGVSLLFLRFSFILSMRQAFGVGL